MRNTSKYILRIALTAALIVTGEGVMWGSTYHSKVIVKASGPTGSGSVYVKYNSTDFGKDDKKTEATASEYENGTHIYYVKAQANTGFHFTGWTNVDNGENNKEIAKVTVESTSTDEENPTLKTVTGNFAENIYYAKLTAKGDGYGSASVTGDATKSTKVQGGGVEFSISATAIPGYHFKEWTTGGAGTFGDSTNPNTTFTAPAATDYDVDNAKEYTVTATFAKDQYKAELRTAISSISEEGTVSTAQVSSNGTDWGTSAVKALEEAGKATKFYVKATAAEGFKFAGWSKEQSSGTVIEGLGAEGEYEVKTASTEGGTNTETIYAIFKRQYDIVISTSLMDYGANSDRIIFDVTGPETYRVSVPIKGSVKITDVAKGTYTVTPVSVWCWKYNFDSASKEITCDAESVNLVTFNATKKITSKKNAENHNTISY